MTDVGDLEQTVADLERIMDEAYSRYARGTERERIDGVGNALENALRAVATTLRPLALELLADRFDTEVAADSEPRLSAELLLLRAEVAELRARAVDAERLSASAIMTALFGDQASDGSIEDPDAAGLAVAIQRLRGFAQDMTSAMLATAQRGSDQKVVSRFQDALRSAVTGKGDQALCDLLQEGTHAAGAQLHAIPAACHEGAQALLQQLDPVLFEHQAEKAGTKVFGMDLFRFRDLWRRFERRHAELVDDTECFKTYFEGPWRAAVLQGMRGARRV